VTLYSTEGGTVGNTVRRTMPSCSRTRSVRVSMRWLIPSMARCSSLNRYGRLPSRTTRSTVHLSPILCRTSVAGHCSYSAAATGTGSAVATIEGTSVFLPDIKLPSSASAAWYAMLLLTA
jgi:hypothetical protein